MAELNKADIQRKVQLAVSEAIYRATGKIYVPVAFSNRHIHLTQADIETLFGRGYQLKVMKALSQPGQFACEETVTIEGPKGRLSKVRVLGPARKATQVEISLTDSFVLGVKGVVRMSGDVAGTPGIRIIGPAGTVEATEGVIVAARHLHLSVEQAQLFGLANGQEVRLVIEGSRGIVMEHVAVRCGAGHDMEVHVDTDEANAAALRSGTMCEVLR